MTIALQARLVFPVDSPPIERGIVTIEGERMVSVGRSSDGNAPVDLGDVALLPAFVNAHTHLEFSHLPRPLGEPGMRMVDWIRLVIGDRGARKTDANEFVAVGRAESRSAGVALLGDIVSDGGATAPVSVSDGEFTTATLPVTTLSFLEVIGFSRARATSVLNALEERLADFQSRSNAFAACGISPHAPYTVSPALLEQLVRLACREQLPMAMHLAESRDELELLADGAGPFQQLLDERSMWDAAAIPRGSRPLDYLQQLAAAPRSLVIHGNYLDAEERRFLAAHADCMSLVFCPRTHTYFQHSPYPLAELLAAGVRVAIGTDSRASNPDLSLLGEMRQIARTHPEITPEMILRMGTQSGAEALGYAAEFGSLAPGKLANIVAVQFAPDESRTPNDALASILHAANQQTTVWMRGKRTN